MNLRNSMILFLVLMVGATILTAGAGGVAQAATVDVQDNRASDAAAIRAHIESIFQAFIDGDIEKIYATHSEDWRGFLGGTPIPIKGIDEYMRANWIEWPRPANAPKRTPYYPADTRYRMSNFDVHFYSPELAVANFIGGFERTIGDATVTLRRFRIMDIYAKRKGSWIQVASHTEVDPEWRDEQMTKPAAVTPELRKEILTAREAVWKAFFSNDRAALDRLLPAEVIAIDNGSKTWCDRAVILAGAKAFAESGGKLVGLEFPETEIQVYGNTMILYTTYKTELEREGKRSVESGRGTEIFVRRGNQLVNVGWQLESQK
jgi:hypothetical protein